MVLEPDIAPASSSPVQFNDPRVEPELQTHGTKPPALFKTPGSIAWPQQRQQLPSTAGGLPWDPCLSAAPLPP